MCNETTILCNSYVIANRLTFIVSFRMATSRVKWSFSSWRPSICALISGFVSLACCRVFTTSSSNWRTNMACFCKKKKVKWWELRSNVKTDAVFWQVFHGAGSAEIRRAAAWAYCAQFIARSLTKKLSNNVLTKFFRTGSAGSHLLDEKFVRWQQMS